MSRKKTNFQLVAFMNEAFGNKRGDPANIDVDRIRRQARNILDEFCELQIALGADPASVEAIQEAASKLTYPGSFDLLKVRDALCDINVFSYGAHHLMGIDADRDMRAVLESVMTRFIKDEADKAKTVAKHAANGVTEVYFEGEYPTMIMKSAADQPDAPKGKFLKSASCRGPLFYQPA